MRVGWPTIRRKVFDAWPKIQITEVDSTGLPDTPLLGSEMTLTATVALAGLSPDEVTVQAVVGRVGADDTVLEPVRVAMAHTGTADTADDDFRHHDAVAGGRIGRIHGACAAAQSAAGRGQRAGIGHARLTAGVRRLRGIMGSA